MTPVAAPPDQQGQVRALFRLLDSSTRGARSKGYQLVGPSGETIPIPKSVVSVFERVAEVIDAMPFDPMEPLVDAMVGRRKEGA